jgi:hypothetical protein
MMDMVVHRHELRATLSRLCHMLKTPPRTPAPAEPARMKCRAARTNARVVPGVDCYQKPYPNTTELGVKVNDTPAASGSLSDILPFRRPTGRYSPPVDAG